MTPRVVVVGAGLAGLACALDLAEQDVDVVVLEAGAVVGGRTSSWIDDGMPVESGLHRFLGFFSELPRLLDRCGVDVDEMVCWEDEVEIRLPDGGPRGILGLAPFYAPWRTLTGVVGNNGLLSPRDKLSLVPFMAAGVKDYVRRPLELDRHSVTDYARRHHVTEQALHNLLIPLTAGIFFLPPERFSAAIFFGLLTPRLPRVHRLRLGAYEGGMTEVMCEPIAQAVRAAGGEVRTGATVTELARDQAGRITGVAIGAEVVDADHVVVATSMGEAQGLLRPAVGDDLWFAPMLSTPTTPSVTIQLELDEPVTDVDRTTFGPGTVLACFAEQSRTTFPREGGRLSIILSPPERFLDRSVDDVMVEVHRDAARLGLDIEGKVQRARIVAHPLDFPSLEPGHLGNWPEQATPVPGLSLAGDYTRQPFVVTMEGAVVSGQRAAEAALAELAEAAG